MATTTTNDKPISYGNMRTFKTQADATYQTAAQVTTAINSRLSTVYKAGGSVTSTTLPALTAENVGKVVNLTDDLTITSDFKEYDANKTKTYPAGTNVVIIDETPAATEEIPNPTAVYKYDVLSGFVDLSGYVQTETGKGLSTNDYTTTEQTKLTNIAENATKVESSETNGNIKINGTETTVYTLPSNVVTTDNMEFATEAEIMALFAAEEA